MILVILLMLTPDFKNKKLMHQPGIEPGSVPWQGTILPLDHWCFWIHQTMSINLADASFSLYMVCSLETATECDS